MTIFINKTAILFLKIGEHLFISTFALLLGATIAIPLGILLSKSKVGSSIALAVSSILQTIPSLALLAIMIPFLGIGKLPAIIALCTYSLLPIVRNTLLGMKYISFNILDASKGMGLKSSQILLQVQLPLALPVIMSGVRLSAVYVISWATIASYIGAGGLGDYIFSGLNTFSIELVLMGAIPVTILALVVDFLMSKLERAVLPRTSSNITGGMSK